MADFINLDLAFIVDWENHNLVSFNSRKTYACMLTHQTGVSDSVFMEFLGTLGVVLSPKKVLWHCHILNVEKNAARKLRFLCQCRRYIVHPRKLCRYITDQYIRYGGAAATSRIKTPPMDKCFLFITRLHRQNLKSSGSSYWLYI